MDERPPDAAFSLRGVLHSQWIGAGVFAPEENAIDESKEDEERDTGKSPGLIAGQQAYQKRDQRKARHRNKRDLAPPQLVAVVAEEGSTHGTADQRESEDNIELC